MKTSVSELKLIKNRLWESFWKTIACNILKKQRKELWTSSFLEPWTELVHLKFCERNFERSSFRKWTFPTLSNITKTKFRWDTSACVTSTIWNFSQNYNADQTCTSHVPLHKPHISFWCSWSRITGSVWATVSCFSYDSLSLSLFLSLSLSLYLCVCARTEESLVFTPVLCLVNSRWPGEGGTARSAVHWSRQIVATSNHIIRIPSSHQPC